VETRNIPELVKLVQAQIIILKILQCIPAVKIFASLDLAKNFSFSDSLIAEAAGKSRC